jgi:hypothetical protein
MAYAITLCSHRGLVRKHNEDGVWASGMAGTSQPRGGLSGVDLEGAQRVDGATLDLGAYESNYVFVGGFE